MEIRKINNDGGAADLMIYRADAVRIAIACREFASDIRLHAFDERLQGAELSIFQSEAAEYDSLADRAMCEFGIQESEISELTEE